MSEIVEYQVKSKDNKTWGPGFTSVKLLQQFKDKGYETRELIVKPTFDERVELARFIEFMIYTLLFTPDELIFDEERKVFENLRIHLAWQCWREALQ